MTEDHKQLADQIAHRLAERMPAHSCLFSEDDRSELKFLCQAIRDVRKASMVGTIAVLIGATFTIIGIGIREWIRGRN